MNEIIAEQSATLSSPQPMMLQSRQKEGEKSPQSPAYLIDRPPFWSAGEYLSRQYYWSWGEKQESF